MDANMAAFPFMQEADIIDDAWLNNTQLSAALLIAGAQEAQTLRSERRNKTCSSYLCGPMDEEAQHEELANSLLVECLQ